MREYYRRMERWLQSHPGAEFAIFLLVPGLAYAVSGMVLSNEGLVYAMAQGLVFGATYALVSVLVRRYRDG